MKLRYRAFRGDRFGWVLDVMMVVWLLWFVGTLIYVVVDSIVK